MTSGLIFSSRRSRPIDVFMKLSDNSRLSATRTYASVFLGSSFGAVGRCAYRGFTPLTRQEHASKKVPNRRRAGMADDTGILPVGLAAKKSTWLQVYSRNPSIHCGRVIPELYPPGGPTVSGGSHSIPEVQCAKHVAVGGVYALMDPSERPAAEVQCVPANGPHGTTRSKNRV